MEGPGVDGEGAVAVDGGGWSRGGGDGVCRGRHFGSDGDEVKGLVLSLVLML